VLFENVASEQAAAMVAMNTPLTCTMLEDLIDDLQLYDTRLAKLAITTRISESSQVPLLFKRIVTI